MCKWNEIVLKGSKEKLRGTFPVFPVYALGIMPTNPILQRSESHFRPAYGREHTHKHTHTHRPLYTLTHTHTGTGWHCDFSHSKCSFQAAEWRNGKCGAKCVCGALEFGTHSCKGRIAKDTRPMHKKENTRKTKKNPK